VGIINQYYWYRLQLELGTGTHSKLYFFPNRDVGGIENISGAAVVASSSHKDAAQKFVSFLVSAQAERILAAGDTFEYPVRPGIAANNVLAPLSQVNPAVIQARSTLLGGCLLVCLSLMAYYGAFEDLHYQTFTTAIFGELRTQFAPGAAASLSLVLVVLSVLVLGGEGAFRERGRVQRSGPMAQRAQTPVPLGRFRLPALSAVVLLVGLALGFPVAVVCYWWAVGPASALPAAVSLGSAAGYTIAYGAAGALTATVLALPVSLLAVRHQRRWSAALERSTFIIQAIPGVVVGLALVFVASRYLSPLYQSPQT
jgi:hypothetical protein